MISKTSFYDLSMQRTIYFAKLGPFLNSMHNMNTIHAEYMHGSISRLCPPSIKLQRSLWLETFVLKRCIFFYHLQPTNNEKDIFQCCIIKMNLSQFETCSLPLSSFVTCGRNKSHVFTLCDCCCFSI